MRNIDNRLAQLFYIGGMSDSGKTNLVVNFKKLARPRRAGEQENALIIGQAHDGGGILELVFEIVAPIAHCLYPAIGFLEHTGLSIVGPGRAPPAPARGPLQSRQL